MTTTTVRTTPISLSRNVITVLGAAIGAVAVWVVETQVLHVDLTVTMGPARRSLPSRSSSPPWSPGSPAA